MINRQAVGIPDIHQDRRVFTAVYRPAFVRSLAVAPVGRDEPIAALGAYWSELRQPQPEDLERLQALADGAALAMANLQIQHAGPGPTTAPAAADPTEHSARVRAALRPAFERFLHQGLRPHSPQAYAVALAAVLVATLLRLGAQAAGAQGTTIFSFYYPAVVLALLVGGRWCGVVAAVAGGLAAFFLFMPPLYALALRAVSDAINLSIYAIACSVIILTIDWHQRMMLRLKDEDARHLTLARETEHRARNAAAIVESIVRQSLKNDPVGSRIINQRIRAASTELAIPLSTRPVRTADLLAHELEPFDLARFTFEGDDETLLAPEVSSVLTLVAHELATNALKYGALSGPDGRVTVAWRISGNRAVVRWREAGGPFVQRPRRQGYGSVLLRRLVELAGGAIVVEFPETGVTAEISLRLDAVEHAATPRGPLPSRFPAGGHAEATRSETPHGTRV